jgi:arsenite-transporting ATPase
MREWRNRLQRFAGPLFSTILPNMNVIDVLSDLAARIKRLREALVDPTRSSYRIVLTPDRTVLREAQRAETYLNLFEYPVDSIYINRVLTHADTAGTHLDALVDRQERVLGDVQAAFGLVPQFHAPLTPDEPVGLERLSRLSRLVFANRDPTDIMHVGRSQHIEQRPNGYVLCIPLPHVEIETLDLTKRGDQLYIDVGNFRREVTLPLVLSDLAPGMAAMRQGVLEIPFEQERVAA